MNAEPGRELALRIALRFAALVGLVVLACIPTPAHAGQDDLLADADAAFEQGDEARALGLYNQVLSQDADNVQALIRSAMLLSWRRQFSDAIARYDRALAKSPDNSQALHERAKVLSWSHRFKEAEVEFRKLLDRDPADREARLGLARSYSWSGRQAVARSEYLKVLDGHPNNAEALVGVGQTYAWSGQQEEAQRWFEKAQEFHPGTKEANLGLAYVDLARGRPEQADARARELERAFPNDAEVAELRREIAKSIGSSLAAFYDHTSDTDDNKLDVYRLEGALSVSRSVELRAGVARYDMRSPGQNAHADALYAGLGWRLAPGHVISVRAGADRLTNSADASSTEAVGGLSYDWNTGGDWSGSLAYNRAPLLYSPAILDNEIMIDAYTATIAGRLGDFWQLAVEGTYWDLSDGVRRPLGTLNISRRWPAGVIRLQTGYAFRWMDFDQHLDHGYFAPSNFTSHSLVVHVAGPFGTTKAYWDVTLEGGVQSFTLPDVHISNDRVLAATGLVGIPLGRTVVFEVLGGYSDFAQQNPAGFKSRQLGARLRWRPGA